MDWANKNVIILGLGAEGQSVAKYLLNKKAKVTVGDKRSAEELGEVYKYWKNKVLWQLGADYLKGLKNFSVVVRSPGIPYLTPEIQEALKSGVQITSQTKEFFSNCPAKIIGVTGTKGKGTTATLIHKMLEAGGKKSYLVGNIGASALEILPQLKSTDWVVYELSSFQLQDIDNSPYVAVLLGITLDHQDHHATLAEYVNAKKNILQFQNSNDYAVLNSDHPNTEALRDAVKGKVFEVSRLQIVSAGVYVADGILWRRLNEETERVIGSKDIKLKGEFNLENTATAVVVASLVGIKIDKIQEVLKTFTGLPHRLEFVARKDGIEYWDNSYATTPETTIAAIRSFKEPIVLMLGGHEKGFSYNELGEAVMASSVKAIVGIGENSEKMYQAIKVVADKAVKVSPEYLEGGEDMTSMVRVANEVAVLGDVVLLSPAAASFDKFKNVRDRGTQFKKAVESL